MRTLVSWRYWVILVVTLLCFAVPTDATEHTIDVIPGSSGYLESPTTGQVYQLDQVLTDLSRADVVYLGETHDQLADHEAQLTLIQSLHHELTAGKHRSLAIAMEMFQRPFQPFLDQYIAGDISEAELRSQTEYEQRWGYPWAYYAPILQFAQVHQIPLLALTAPSEVTNTIILKGFSGLSDAEQQWIPPLSEFDLNVPDYRELLYRFYKEVHQNHGNSEDFDLFFLIQTLWDETMATVTAQFMQTHPHTQVIVLAGQGHIVYDFGIPQRVERRSQARSSVQRSILINPDPTNFQLETVLPQADYFWQQSGAMP